MKTANGDQGTAGRLKPGTQRGDGCFSREILYGLEVHGAEKFKAILQGH